MFTILLNGYSHHSAKAYKNMQLGDTRNMENLAKRLKFARQRAGMTQKQLADAAAMRQSDISKIEIGEIQRTTFIGQLSRALGCDPIWLETGDGEPLKGPGLEPGPALRGRVPLISWVQAGAWAGAQEARAHGDAEAWLASPATSAPGAFALRVRGDSMIAPGVGKSYPEGSIIFVNPERRAPVNGERVIAKLDGSDEVTFKVYKNEDGRQWLQPLNPAHLPIRDEFRVLGTVFGKWEPE